MRRKATRQLGSKAQKNQSVERKRHDMPPKTLGQSALPLAALITATLFATANTANAQSGGVYNITKSTIDGGGVTLHSGGIYRLGGTVGQHDATRLTGGIYKLTGGFWSPVIPSTAAPDQTGLDKSRFISFSIPTSAFVETALRVKFITLHSVVPPYTGGASVPFTLFEGQSQYVGPPTQYVESASSGTPLYASQLQCAPYYQDWSTVGLLHVSGEAIVPSSNYEVENLAASCAGNESSCVAISAPLEVKTTRWGDVETPYNPPSPDPQPDTSDISAMVNKFKSALGAPIKARALLAGSNARGAIGPGDISPDFNFTHISLCVDAFKGLPYPYKPGKCAGDAAKACVSDSDCMSPPNPTTGPCILCP